MIRPEDCRTLEDLKGLNGKGYEGVPWSLMVKKIMFDCRTRNKGFYKWLLTKESIGYVFSSFIYLQAYKVYRSLRRDSDQVIVISGIEGSGKSTFAMQFASIVDPTFCLNRICFDKLQFFQNLENSKPGDAVQLDEGNLIIYNRDYSSKSNKNVMKLFSVMRMKNVCTIVCVPDFRTLDPYVRTHRVSALINLNGGKARGTGMWINKDGIHQVNVNINLRKFMFKLNSSNYSYFFFSKRVPIINDLLGLSKYKKYKEDKTNEFIKDVREEEESIVDKMEAKKNNREFVNSGALPDLLSVSMVSKKIGRASKTVNGYIKAGKLAAKKQGKYYYITREEFERFVAENYG